MSSYKRRYLKGRSYFFTVVTYRRKKIFIDEPFVAMLRESFKYVMKKWPFKIDAIVVLPDHLHCVWQMPPYDADFSTRWMLIKSHFSRSVKGSVNKRNEKQIWQRRFWEHVIRDEDDWRAHMDYIHYNPVKHGYVSHPGEWMYGSYQKFIENGYYPENWGMAEPENVKEIDVE